MKKVLLIEDDEKLKKYIGEYLYVYNYKVFTIEDFNLVLEKVKEVKPDLIILDINLPKFDGFYFLRVIRKSYNIPILILSARSDEGEQIRGMELGADDYMTKPFSMGILLAKINALLRRNNEYINDDIENIGDIMLIHDSMKLKYKNQVYDLTKNEYRVLNILIKNIGKVVTREELLDVLWDDEIFVDDNTLTVNMSRVKKKLSELGLDNAIKTKRGVGYVFEEIND